MLFITIIIIIIVIIVVVVIVVVVVVIVVVVVVIVIEDIRVFPSTILVNPVELVDFNLTCTVLSHPLVIINWNITTPIPRQVPVGFRGPSVSELILNSGDFIGRNILTCLAELNQIIVMETITVDAFSELHVTIM